MVSMLIVSVITALIGWVFLASDGVLARQAFYMLPIILAVSWLGLWWGLSIALFSAVVRFFGDFTYGGVTFSDTDGLLHAVASRLSLLLVYIIVAVVIHELLQLNRELEQRVQTRTTALKQAVAARERLQNTLFESARNERGVIGRELHDGLGQHLTATAMAADILALRLADRGDPLADHARQVEDLVRAGIEQTRNVARGLLLDHIQPENLVSELEELVATTRQQGVVCQLTTEGEPTSLNVNQASHLFYIAREAVRNALRHAGGDRVTVRLVNSNAFAALTIVDNGRGLGASSPSESAPGGMGLHIMAQRAELLGGRLRIAPAGGGGTCVDCLVPLTGA